MKYRILLSAILLTMGLARSIEAQDAAATPGVTDKEIKIGSTAPLTGPAASYSVTHTVIKGYFDALNKKGGINGRSVDFIVMDDAYNPAKTVEQTKKLVERDNVAFIAFATGTANGMAVRQYLNDLEVPQIMLASGAFPFNDPKNWPWTTPGLPDYAGEAGLYAKYILQNHPDAKIAILHQNDDYGKLYVGAFTKVLGDKAKDMIVAKESYEVANPTIKAQMLKLQNSGATVFLNITTPKQAIQSLQELKGSDWKPVHIMTSVAAIKDVVFKAAGFENAKDVITAAVTKDVSDPIYDNDKGVADYKNFINTTFGGKQDPGNILVQFGYAAANVIEQILRKAGKDLSRKHILEVATNLQVDVPLLLPGIEIKVTPEDYRPYKEMQLVKFDGQYWKPIGGPQKFEF